MSVFSQARIDVFFNKADALKGIKELKNTVKSSANDMKSSFMGTLGKLGAAYLGGKMFKSAYDDMNNIVNMANKWGRSTEGISVLSNAMTMLGGSTEDALNTVDTLEQAITDLRTTGSGPLKSVASQIGAQIYNADGSLKNYSQLLSEIRQKLKLVKDDATRTKVLQELGLTSPTQINYMTMSEEKLKRINKEAKKQGVITKDSAKTMEKFNESVGKLKASFKSLVGELMGDFSPLIDIFKSIVDFISDLPSGVRKVILGLSALKLTGVFGILGKLYDGFKKIGALKGMWIGLKTVVLGLFNAIAAHPVIAGITALVAGMYALYKWYQKLKGEQDEKNEEAKKWLNEQMDDPNSWVSQNLSPAINGQPVKQTMSKVGDELPTYTPIQKMSPLMSTAPDFSKYPSSVTNSSRTVNIENMNITSPDARGVMMEFQNNLNRSMAGGVI